MKSGPKKVLLIIVPVLALFIVYYYDSHYERIPLTENLRFGMRPIEVRMKYGKPQSKEASDLSPSFAYLYMDESNEYKKIITISFIKVRQHYELYELNISCIDVPEEGKAQLYKSIVEECRNEYCSKDEYYETSDEGKTSLGLRQGAVSLDCDIETGTTDVRIHFSKLY